MRQSSQSSPSRLRQPGYAHGGAYAPPDGHAFAQQAYSPTYGGGGGGGSPYMAYGGAVSPTAMPMMMPAGMGVPLGGGGSPMMMGGGGGFMGPGAGMMGGGGGFHTGSDGGAGGESYTYLSERGSMLDLMSGEQRRRQRRSGPSRSAAPPLNAFHPLPAPHQRATSCSTRATWRARTTASSASASGASGSPMRPRRPCTPRR